MAGMTVEEALARNRGEYFDTPPAKLTQHKKVDYDSGRITFEYTGPKSDWMDQFKAKGYVQQGPIKYNTVGNAGGIVNQSEVKQK